MLCATCAVQANQAVLGMARVAAMPLAWGETAQLNACLSWLAQSEQPQEGGAQPGQHHGAGQAEQPQEVAGAPIQGPPNLLVLASGETVFPLDSCSS